MTIIRHADLPFKAGQHSKTSTRHIVDSETILLWDQIIPVGGYIKRHTHECAETLTFLNGKVEVTLSGKTSIVGADMTVFIPANQPHAARNVGDEPVRLLVFFPTNRPNTQYIT